jgi:hypothetical protein
MSDEYDLLVEGYEGLGSPADDPGPLTPAERQRAADMLVTGDQVETDEPEPFVEGDGFDTVPPAELRVLKPDQLPRIGQHYVIVDGVPRPVIREGYECSEDEHVRRNMADPTSHHLKDPDASRRRRADRTLRMRYRRFLCGESPNL